MIPAIFTVAFAVSLVVMGAYRVNVPEAYFLTVAALVLSIFIGITSHDRPSNLD